MKAFQNEIRFNRHLEKWSQSVLVLGYFSESTNAAKHKNLSEDYCWNALLLYPFQLLNLFHDAVKFELFFQLVKYDIIYEDQNNCWKSYYRRKKSSSFID